MRKVVGYSFLFIFAITLLSACSGGKIEGDYKTVSDLRWRKTDKYVFESNITEVNIGKVYKFDVTLRHHLMIAYDQIPIVVTVTSSSGEQKMEKVLVIRNGNEDTGEVMGELVDSRVTMSDTFKYTEGGKYTVSVTHNLPGEDIANNVIEVGYEVLPIEE